MLLSLSLLCGCTTQSEQCCSEDKFVKISGTDLLYEMPFPETTVVANNDQLGPSLAMCVVDTVREISVLLINLPARPVNRQDVEAVVRRISSQSAPGLTCTSTDEVTECQYLDIQAWSFESIIALKNAEDSIRVLFNGRIFEDKALVVTANREDSVNFEPYLAGLKRAL